MGKDPVPADEEWLRAQGSPVTIRLEPTDVRRAELTAAQAVVDAELRAWSIESYATGQASAVTPPDAGVVGRSLGCT